MLSIEGEYSFRNLALFFSNSGLPIETRLTSGIKLVEDGKEIDFLLSPRNCFYEKRVIDQNQFVCIDFDLFDRKLDKFGTFSILEIDYARYFIFFSAGDCPAVEDLKKIALNSLTCFFQSEFDARDFFYFDSVDAVFDITMQLKRFATDFVSSDGKMRSEYLESRRIIPITDQTVPDEILTAGPSISPLEVSYVSQAAKMGWNADHSTYLTRFEKEFADFVGTEFALATSSCTGALHLSLLALGIGPGDEVVVPDITWVATASAVRYVGATPIFVDVDPETWTLDPTKLESVINGNTRAIIPVHLYGFGAPMVEILRIARKHGLFVVEDAAPAIGTSIEGRLAGSFGDFGCFSFQGAKLLVTGEGGMLVTNNAELFAKAKKIQDHGRRPGTFWIEELGYKYKMNNLTAALGLAQLQRAGMQIEKKREINSWYREGLAGLDGLRFQVEAVGTRSICWMTSFSLDQSIKTTRDDLRNQLKKYGVDTRPVFPSISQYDIWGYRSTIPRFSKIIGDTGLNLPSGVLMNKASVKKIVDLVIKIMD